MAFLCVCADAYQSYTCVEAFVLSMLFHPDLNVPDILREKQLKGRERINPRPGVRHPSVASHARLTHDRVRYQV